MKFLIPSYKSNNFISDKISFINSYEYHKVIANQNIQKGEIILIEYPEINLFGENEIDKGLQKEGEDIKKLYKLQANKLVLGVADAGSYSSSIKGNITDKKLKDWSYGYANTNGFTGAGMALVD